MTCTQIPEIELSNVSAAVGGYTVVTGVSFSISPGEKLAIVGTNGAGKSTLLRTIAGISAAPSGTVTIGGKNVAKMRLRQRAKLMSFVAQEDAPPADLTLSEMVCLGRIPHRPAWAVTPEREMKIVRQSLDCVGLGDRLNTPCDRLSGGERRRAMLARGLAQNCPVLILDEPTNHLDIAWTLRMLGFLSNLDATVITAIHDLDLVLRYFDKVAVLHDHKLLAFGAPKDVLSSATINDAFNVSVTQTTHPHTGASHLLISEREEPENEA